jgi:SPP1 gp7 family putative phage head morphogenesis protein
VRRKKTMYEYADKIVSYLNGRFIEMFGKLKALSSFDELNLLHSVKELYREADELTRKMLYQIAVFAYENAEGEDISAITEQWLLEVVLEAYDPTTKYSYVNEVERKCSRLFESVMSSDNKAKEVDTALRYWSAMVTQYSIITTDAATLRAYTDSGISEVMWVSVKDNRRCSVCKSRDGKIYPIEDVPSKPHIGCRCYLIPYSEE